MLPSFRLGRLRHLWGIAILSLCAVPTTLGSPHQIEGDSARWIGLAQTTPARTSAPRNRHTLFRKAVDLPSLPEDATLHFAASSDARLWINGQLVRRKVSRYHEEGITAEVVNAGPYLRTGRNVVVVQHHNWGDIVTFQRSGNQRLGLYLNASWIATDRTWQMRVAPEFVPHEVQILGVQGTERIRFPVYMDGRRQLAGNLHDPAFDASDWDSAAEIDDGPWPATPRPVETPGQREHLVRPMAVLAAGRSTRTVSDDPATFATGLRDARYHPDAEATQDAAALVTGGPLILEGQAGESQYVTLDFFRPVHGYPVLELAEAVPGAQIDIGYTEIPRSAYDGRMHVDPETGWIDPTGVVGDRYADRYVTRSGTQSAEIPDERTARWMTIHVQFPESGRVVIKTLGIVKSQYPVDWVGSFATGHEHIDQLVKLSLIHAEVTMTDAYVDTPGREDGQWYEDARLRAEISARWFGDVRLRDFLLRTVVESQRPDGLFHNFPPTNFAFITAYDWTMQWAAILYDQYWWTGDTELIRTYWEPLTRYWDNVLASVDENGVWITRAIYADIRVGQKVQAGQSSGIVTPGIIERLRWSAELTRAIGETEHAEVWEAEAQRMARAFREVHVVPALGGLPAHVADRYDPTTPETLRGFSQAGQTIAVYTDLLTSPEAQAVLDYAFPAPVGSPPPPVTRWNNPTFSYRVLRALTHADRTDRAVAHLIERYSQYLPGHPANPIPLTLQGPYGGPLPEYWLSREDAGVAPGDTLLAQPVDPTGSHGWAAIPLLWLHDTLLGVELAEPGGGRLRIAPRTGGLPFVQGHTITPKGHVWVSWQPQQWTVTVEIPDGVTAEVILPSAFEGHRVRVSQSDGFAQETTPGIFDVRGAGRYVFEAY